MAREQGQETSWRCRRRIKEVGWAFQRLASLAEKMRGQAAVRSAKEGGVLLEDGGAWNRLKNTKREHGRVHKVW